MKYPKLFFLISLFVITIFSQSLLYAQKVPSIEWEKCFGGSFQDYALSLIHTSDGGYVFAGYTLSDDGDVAGNHNPQSDAIDGWVVKLDADGAIEWQRCCGGSADDGFTCIIQTSDGGFAVAGNTTSQDGDVKGYHGGGDLWLFKLDSLGNLLWQKCLGGKMGEGAASLVESTGEGGGLVVVGYTNSTDGDVIGKHAGTGDSASDIWVVKVNSDNGAIQWQKCFGGSADDNATCIINTTDHGYAICGETYSNDGDVSGFHPGNKNPDSWVIKLNSSGTLQWQKRLGGTGSDVANQIIQTSDGGYAIVGSTNSTNGDVLGLHVSKFDSSQLQYPSDVWVVKLNSSGKIVRQKCLGGYESESGQTLFQNTEGDFIIGSKTTSTNDGDVTSIHGSADIWIVKIDSSFNIIWQECLGGSAEEGIFSMIQLGSGEIVLAGASNSHDGNVTGVHGLYGSDVWIVKLGTTLGVEAWYSNLNNDNSLKIYPNPSVSNVRLQVLPTQTVTHVEFYSIMGTPVFPEYKADNNIALVDVHTLSNGTYISRVTYFDGFHNNTISLPLVVEH